MGKNNFITRIANAIGQPFSKRSSSADNKIMTLNEFADWMVRQNPNMLVTREQALEVPIFKACVELMAKTLAQIPLYLYRKSGNRTEKAVNHPYYKTFNLQPNEFQTSYTFRYSIYYNLFLYGNAYALKTKDKDGNPYLYPIESPRVQVVVKNKYNGNRRYSEYFYKIYPTQESEIDIEVPTSEMIHLAATTDGCLEGKDNYAKIQPTVSLAMCLRKFGLNFFKNAMNPNIAIIFPEGLGSDTAVENFKKDLAEKYAGLKNTGKPLVIETKADIKPMEMNLLQSQYVELCDATDKDIARWFGIPPHLLGIMDGANYDSNEQSAIEFIKYCLMPWLIQSEQQYAIKTLDPIEQETYFYKHNVDSLLRAETLVRTQAQVLQVNNGLRTVNEVREDDDLNPVDGGDVARCPLNIDDLNKDLLKEPQKQTKTKGNKNESNV